MAEGSKLSRFGKAVAHALLSLDSFIDSWMYESGRRSLNLLRAITAGSERLRLSGGPKFFIDGVCETLNVSLVVIIGALALAQPAIQATEDEDWLKRSDLAVTFLDRYGAEVGHRGIRHADAVPFDELPDHFIKAVLATEDRRFFNHFGIDLIGTLRAITVNAHAGGVVQGGSSITQQLAKNVFLSNERSISRKITEAWLALWLEHRLTKKEILGLYLDRAYMGSGAFGVQAAAEHYFGKSARDIDLAEAAMLAGLFKAPTKYSPNVNLPAARARANDVLSNLVDAGFMTDSQVYSARRNPATPVEEAAHTSPDWYLDFAYNEIKTLVNAGKLKDDRVLTVRTGLDQGLQQQAESVLEEQLKVNAPAYNAHQAAAVVADTDGLVRAIVGGRDYGASQFNRATDALRQPGSSFKIFVYLAALLTGKYHSSTPIDASGICIGDYCVNNYRGERGGSMPLYYALAQSYNTAAIRLSLKIGESYWPPKQSYHMARMAALGRSKIVELARAMGLTTSLPDAVSLPVGADEVKMIDMVGANAILANGGRRAVSHAAVEIHNSSGKLVYSRERDGPSPDQVVPADKVAEMNNIMTHVVTEGTGRAAAIPGLAISGKTGTTNNSTNAWFNGFTGNLVCSVWFGNDDNSGMGDMTGGTLPATSWHNIMAYAQKNLDPKPPYGVTQPSGAAPSAPTAKSGGGISIAARPAGLAPKSAQIILEIGDFARAAGKHASIEPAGRASVANAGVTLVRGGELIP